MQYDDDELDIEDMANKFRKLATMSKPPRIESAKKRERETKDQKIAMFKMQSIYEQGTAIARDLGAKKAAMRQALKRKRERKQRE